MISKKKLYNRNSLIRYLCLKTKHNTNLSFVLCHFRFELKLFDFRFITNFHTQFFFVLTENTIHLFYFEAQAGRKHSNIYEERSFPRRETGRSS